MSEYMQLYLKQLAIQKIINHLWYLTDGVSVFGIFFNSVEEGVKVKIMENLDKENQNFHGIRLVISRRTGWFTLWKVHKYNNFISDIQFYYQCLLCP